MIEALIFDFGNVLCRFDNAILHRQVAALTNGRSAPAEVRAVIYGTDFDWNVNRGRYGPTEMFERLSSSLGIAVPYEAFASAWNEIFMPQPGIDALLDRVAGRYRLLVLSNINPIHATYVRETAPLLQRFDRLLFSCEAGLAKPEAAVYELAAQLAGVPPDRCLFMDDIEPYVEAARSAGMQAFQFTTVAAATVALERLGVLPARQ